MLYNACRVLNSLEQFAAGVDITKENQFILQSFGMTFVNIVPDVFEGQTFSLFNTNGKETSNVTNSITDWGIKVTNRSAADIANDFFATLHIPKDSVSECILRQTNQWRLAYFAFFMDSLFHSKSHQIRVDSIIIAVRVNCNVSELSTPVNIMIHHNQVDMVLVYICMSTMKQKYIFSPHCIVYYCCHPLCTKMHVHACTTV